MIAASFEMHQRLQKRQLEDNTVLCRFLLFIAEFYKEEAGTFQRRILSQGQTAIVERVGLPSHKFIKNKRENNKQIFRVQSQRNSN